MQRSLAQSKLAADSETKALEEEEMDGEMWGHEGRAPPAGGPGRAKQAEAWSSSSVAGKLGPPPLSTAADPAATWKLKGDFFSQRALRLA